MGFARFEGYRQHAWPFYRDMALPGLRHLSLLSLLWSLRSRLRSLRSRFWLLWRSFLRSILLFADSAEHSLPKQDGYLFQQQGYVLPISGAELKGIKKMRILPTDKSVSQRG